MKKRNASFDQTSQVLHNGTQSRSATILVVDDEVPTLTLLHSILGDLGYVVLIAESGEDALRLAGGIGRRIDLLITDLLLPGMSGYQLAAAFKSVQPGAKVIFISNYPAGSGMYLAARKDGAHILESPITVENVAEMAPTGASRWRFGRMRIPIPLTPRRLRRPCILFL